MLRLISSRDKQWLTLNTTAFSFAAWCFRASVVTEFEKRHVDVRQWEIEQIGITVTVITESKRRTMSVVY